MVTKIHRGGQGTRGQLLFDQDPWLARAEQMLRSARQTENVERNANDDQSSTSYLRVKIQLLMMVDLGGEEVSMRL